MKRRTITTPAVRSRRITTPAIPRRRIGLPPRPRRRTDRRRAAAFGVGALVALLLAVPMAIRGLVAWVGRGIRLRSLDSE